MGSLRSSLRKVSIRSTMFLIYLFIGAGIFLGLEREASITKLKKHKTEFESDSKMFRESYNISEEKFNIMVGKILHAFEEGVFSSDDTSSWSFASAFFFCGNVITTIGYGTIVPKTPYGRIVMMFYAFFGIPLTGFFLRTVGNELTSLIAYLVKYYERRLLNREAEKLEMKCALIASVLALFMLFLGAGIFTSSETQWDYLGGFYFCFVTLTTIGFGDLVPGQVSQVGNVAERLGVEMASLIYYVLGLSIMSGVIVSISSVIEEKTKKLDVTDPMDAIRNLRIENLNSKAMKKLGYKVDEGMMLPPTLREGRMMRRGTIIPDTDQPKRRVGRLANDHLNLPNGNSSQERIENGGTHLRPPSDVQNSVKQVAVDVSPTPSVSTSPTLPPRRNNPTTDTSRPDENILSNPNRIDEDENSGKTSAEPVIRIYSVDESEFIELKDNEIDKVIMNKNTNNDGVKNTENAKNESTNDTKITNRPKRTKSDPYLRRKTELDGSMHKQKNNKFLQFHNVDFSSKDFYHKIQYSYNNNNNNKNNNALKKSSTRKPDIRHSSKVTQHVFEDGKSRNTNTPNSSKRSNTIGNSTKRHSQRLGLPAELFANHVSVSLNTPDNYTELKVPELHSFYEIPQTSPSIQNGYSNPFFRHDDTPPHTANSLDVDETRMKNSSWRRRSSTGGFSTC